MIGATLPGTPAVALGRNRFIAWGATNVAADVEDLYREQLDATGTHAEFRGVQEPITVIPETIVVKGAAPGAARRARHAPRSARVGRDQREQRATSTRPAEAAAARAARLPLDGARRRRSTLAAFLKLNEARNWTEFTDALRDFVVAVAEFRLRRRRRPHRLLRAGPHPDPRSRRRIASRPTAGPATPSGPAGFRSTSCRTSTIRRSTSSSPRTIGRRPRPIRYHLGLEWPEPYRAQRITDLLAGSRTADAKLTPDDFARIQADTVSLHAKTLLPLLLAHAHPRRRRRIEQAVSMLRAWNFDATADSAATGDFQAWFHAAHADARRRRSRAARRPRQLPERVLVRHAVSSSNTLTDPQTAAWCDDVTTPARDLRRRGDRGARQRGRRSDAAARQRHDALAVGRRAPRDVPASGARFASPRCVRSSAARCPTAATGARQRRVRSPPTARYEQHDRSPATARSSICRRPTTAASSTRVGQSAHPLSSHYDDFLPTGAP